MLWRKFMKNRKKLLSILLCTVISVSVLAGCGDTDTVEIASDVAIVEVKSPEVGSLKLSGSFIATISPDESVYVIPKTTAEVLSVNVSAGDVVSKGDVLAVLDDTLAQISMKSAQLNLDNAQSSYNLQYGDSATLLNDMQSDSNLSQAADGVNQLQENLVDAMDSLQRYKEKLKETQEQLDEAKEQEEEMKKTMEEVDMDSLEGAMEYMEAMTAYQQITQAVSNLESAVSQYQSAIDQCEDTIETLQDNIDSSYNSYSQAVTSTNISNGEMREEQKKVSQNSIEAAQLSIDQAQESLEAYTITATISGVIESVNISEHDYATSSNYAFVISNKDAMIATYYVSEDVRNTFKLGQQITLEKDDMTYQGEIEEIGTAIDQTTGLFKIKAVVTGDTSNLLSGTKATVITDTYHEDNAVIIPYDSVYYDGTQAYVYCVVDGKAKRTNIETGLYDNENIVITDGLSSDDVVITTWAAQLRDGVDVSIKENTQE
jgi:RND family efflux transporter MFP subunit